MPPDPYAREISSTPIGMSHWDWREGIAIESGARRIREFLIVAPNTA